MLLVRAVVKQQSETVSGTDTKVVAALGADLLIFFYGFAPDDLAASLTLLPQPFRADILFSVRCRDSFDGGLLPREPGHAKSATTVAWPGSAAGMSGKGAYAIARALFDQTFRTEPNKKNAPPAVRSRVAASGALDPEPLPEPPLPLLVPSCVSELLPYHRSSRTTLSPVAVETVSQLIGCEIESPRRPLLAVNVSPSDSVTVMLSPFNVASDNRKAFSPPDGMVISISAEESEPLSRLTYPE